MFFKKIIFAVILMVSFAHSETIVHNGITYGTVTSPYTGRVWLDRNLGASRVCQSYDDEQCYGDYYQWGRDADGHEKSNSSTTSTQATNVTNVGHGNFITSSSDYDYDWAKDADSDGSKRSINWGKIDGSSICPTGFRVPNEAELKAETTDQDVNNTYDLFSTFLKVPAAGVRYDASGGFGGNGVFTALYTTFSATTDGVRVLEFGNTGVSIQNSGRASGYSVRCIKDPSYIPTNQLPTPNAGQDQSIIIGQSITLSASKSNDSDGEIVKYEWYENNTLISTDINVTLSDLEIGEHTFTLRVTDDDGAVAEDSVKVTVNKAPDFWYVYGLDENYAVSSNEQFYIEFSMYVDTYHEDKYQEFSNKDLIVSTNNNDITVSCLPIKSFMYAEEMMCKITGKVQNSTSFALTLSDSKHDFEKSIDIGLDTSNIGIEIIERDTKILIDNDKVIQHPVVMFELHDMSLDYTNCTFKNKSGEDINLYMYGGPKGIICTTNRYLQEQSQYALFSGYTTSSEEMIDNLVAVAKGKEKIDIKIKSSNVLQTISIPVYERNSTNNVAVLELYEKITTYSDGRYAEINNARYDFDTLKVGQKFYLDNNDSVHLKGGIWKLLTNDHEVFINIEGLTGASELKFYVEQNSIDNVIHDNLNIAYNTNSYVDILVKKTSSLFNNIDHKLTIMGKMLVGGVDDIEYQGDLIPTAAVRGTTFQIVKEPNQPIRYNLLEGEVEIAENNQSVVLKNMTSYKDGNVTKLNKDTLSAKEKLYLTKTALYDANLSDSIDSVTIKTNLPNASYFLLGKNVQSGYGQDTLFKYVLEGNYTLSFMPRFGYKRPHDVNLTIDNNNDNVLLKKDYQKFVDIYIDDNLQNQNVDLNLSDKNIKIMQNNDDKMLFVMHNSDTNTSLVFDSNNSSLKVDTSLHKIIFSTQVKDELSIEIDETGKSQIKAKSLTLPKDKLPFGTQSEIIGSKIKLTIPVDNNITF